ncbi:IclR family transcriptional regulator [soil metagenome]
MSKTGNVLQVLRLFTEERRQLKVADVARLLDVSSATAYRYVLDLVDAGLIESPSAGQYVLGPAIVELDRQIRVHDPLIAAAADIMQTLSDRTGGTALLSRLHGRRVVCVHQVAGRNSPETVSYERGRSMPLYRGATSKIILAHLGRETIEDITQTDSPALRAAGLPVNLQELLDLLETWRAQPAYATAGEVDAEAMGWAVAIHHGKRLLGSLSLIMSRKSPPADLLPIADALRRAALRIEGRLDAAAPTNSLPKEQAQAERKP